MDVWQTRSGQFKALANVWFCAVDAAADEKELLAAVRDYLATWSPLELSLIPEDCRPGRVGGMEEIGELAYKLGKARVGLQGTATDRMVFERLHAFFMQANIQASRLLAAQARLDAANQA